MIKEIKNGFEYELLNIDLDNIISSKANVTKIMRGKKYRQILISIQKIGLVEQPVVFFDKIHEKYVVLDGHLRIIALKELGFKNVNCLISNDDESYTYNKHINKISIVQENKMIENAIKNGVSEKHLADVLNLNITYIRDKRYLLTYICSDAQELLKDKHVNEHVFRFLKKMKPVRQIEAALLMNEQNSYSEKFAKELLDATPDEMLATPRKRRKYSQAELDKIHSLEEENLALRKDINSLRDKFGIDLINLTAIQSYLKRLLSNTTVSDYLQKNYPHFLEQFQQTIKVNFITTDGL